MQANAPPGANALGQAADFAGARHSLAGQVAKGWVMAIEARQQVSLAKLTLATHEITAAQIHARFELGIISSLDARLAKSNFASTKAQVAELESVASSAIRQLEVLLGQFPANKLTVPAELPAMPPAIPVGVPAEILSRRPDLVAAEQRLFATGASLTQANASLYPQFSLTASGGTSTSELSGLISGDSVVWNVAANLTQPVFQAGRLRAKVRLQQANLKAAEEGVPLNDAQGNGRGGKRTRRRATVGRDGRGTWHRVRAIECRRTGRARAIRSRTHNGHHTTRDATPSNQCRKPMADCSAAATGKQNQFAPRSRRRI